MHEQDHNPTLSSSITACIPVDAEPVQYTWQALDDLKNYGNNGNMGLTPRDLFDTPNRRLFSWLNENYGGDPELHMCLYDFLFRVPLEDIPLHINHKLVLKDKSVPLETACKWRLKNGV